MPRGVKRNTAAKPTSKASRKKSLTRTELIELIAEATAGFTKDGLSIAPSDVKCVLNAQAAVAAALLKKAKKGEHFQVIPGAVKLTLSYRSASPAHMGRNPATGEAIMVPAKPAKRSVRASVMPSFKRELF